jgi:hypothetical protein
LKVVKYREGRIPGFREGAIREKQGLGEGESLELVVDVGKEVKYLGYHWVDEGRG